MNYFQFFYISFMKYKKIRMEFMEYRKQRINKLISVRFLLIKIRRRNTLLGHHTVLCRLRLEWRIRHNLLARRRDGSRWNDLVARRCSGAGGLDLRAWGRREAEVEHRRLASNWGTGAGVDGGHFLLVNCSEK